MKSIRFLTKEFILHFHRQILSEYGGRPGLRDEGLLESAYAQAQMTIDGEYLHRDVFEMAAAYGYHICQNHAFIDGNKRLALVAIDTFLHINGWELIADERETYVIILRLAAGELNKQQLSKWIREHVQKR